MMPQSSHFRDRNASKLVLRLQSKWFASTVVGFSLLHVLPLPVTAGVHESKPTSVHQSKPFLRYAPALHAGKLLRGQPHAPKAIDDSKDPYSRFHNSHPSVAVKNRRMFGHQDKPQLRFDNTRYSTRSIESPVGSDAGALQTFPGQAHFDDDTEDSNPWINTDDYAIVVALRWIDPEDYDNTVVF